VLASVLLPFVAPAFADAPAAPALPGSVSPEEHQRIERLSEEDHQAMLDLLGITALRPGRHGRPTPGDPYAANYDEAKANPYPDYPDPLVCRDGTPVTIPELWWQKRRPEIVEAFESEVVGRVPAGVPRVTWRVDRTLETTIAGLPVIARALVGHVDNSAWPAIGVNLRMAVVLPRGLSRPVPVLEMFGAGNMPDEPSPRRPGQVDPPVPTAPEQLIGAGWGYVSLATASIQADNGAGLTQGIIGLTNHGQRRRPEDWGALRAWAWGAARGLDYLETLPEVDAHHVGIEGVSRYGKAALVTMAFEPRFALALVGSSGEGGVKPHRRNFGEALENLTSTGEYHWMAGNFLKYGADASGFGRKDAGDLPVDSPELIALCAPRPTFISYGVPERGDALWLDQQGGFMATVAAGPVFRLLGVRDLGVGGDYRTAQLPPVNTPLLAGTLAWRQHDGGHEDRSNLSFFLAWADREIKYRPALRERAPTSAAEPTARSEPISIMAHQELVAKARRGGIDLYFLGDSITRRWGATDYPDLLADFSRTFYGWNAGNFGWGADRIENMLWRVEHGELAGVNPKVIVILAGTNNIGKAPPTAAQLDDIAKGYRALVNRCQALAPDATVVLTAVFPRNDNPAVYPAIRRLNQDIAGLADGARIRFLDVNAGLADAAGILRDGMTVDRLHPTLEGYHVWAAGLRPVLTELLGPPADADTAPPPTGDPAAELEVR